MKFFRSLILMWSFGYDDSNCLMVSMRKAIMRGGRAASL